MTGEASRLTDRPVRRVAAQIAVGGPLFALLVLAARGTGLTTLEAARATLLPVIVGLWAGWLFVRWRFRPGFETLAAVCFTAGACLDLAALFAGWPPAGDSLGELAILAGLIAYLLRTGE